MVRYHSTQTKVTVCAGLEEKSQLILGLNETATVPDCNGTQGSREVAQIGQEIWNKHDTQVLKV